MKRIAIMLVAVLGCGKSDVKAGPAPSPGPPAPAAAAVAAPATPPAPVPQIEPCSLVSAAEVGAAIGKTVVANTDGPQQCSYGLDPAEQQKAIAELDKGGLAGMVKGGGIKMPSAITNQLAVTLEISPERQSEAELKQLYAGVGSAVDKLDPKAHGLDGAITNGQELKGLGDWAFTTNIASVNMGNGISTRGRLLQAQQGAWRLTLSVTIAPDPGAAKLDDEMVAIVKPALAKLR
ncbi:MAG: hypothetical protein ABJE66_00110 [Deltaproteobacteria bacterium]